MGKLATQALREEGIGETDTDSTGGNKKKNQWKLMSDLMEWTADATQTVSRTNTATLKHAVWGCIIVKTLKSNNN